MEKGLIFNVQRFSLHDGPGIRTTIFFKGCPLRCSWCQNPEGIEPNPQLLCYANRCIGCESCLNVCPEKAISITPRGPEIDYLSCRACFECTAVCPTGALEQAGRAEAVSALVEEGLKDRFIFEQSGGGVSFSGGEPLMQPDFLLTLLKAFKNEGVHTVVDTCGYADRSIMEAVLDWADMVIFDLKFVDDDKSVKHTGVNCRQIVENLKLLLEAGTPYRIRMPIIPTINDSREDIGSLAGLLKELKIGELEIIPYHRYGSAKYARLGLDYTLGDLEQPSADSLEEAINIFRSYNIKAYV